MGFLDHLFKLKQSDEKMGEGGKNGKNGGTASDPGAFLHPKDFGPRGASLPPPVRPAAPGAKMPPPPMRGLEIVLTLGDVLSRIPTEFLQAGLHDSNRELRFSVDDLSADIARGRAAVPLSRIAALCPDVFAREITPGDDSEIRLPLQKLVEQIGLLRRGPATPETALAKDSPPDCEIPPASEGKADPFAPPAVPTAATVIPDVRVFTPPPPQVIAEPAAAAPPENRASHPEPNAAPPDAPTATDAPPLPALHIHPPPVVRPVLVHPPTLLTEREHPPEPLVSSIPSPSVEAARAPETPPDQPAPFPQEALQALFMTDEILDLAAISRRAAALPGVRACALEWRGKMALGGDVPDGFDLAALRTAAARMHNAGTLPIGALENLTLHGDQAAISIFTRPGVLLAVLHRPLPPGVRERLAALASTLTH